MLVDADAKQSAASLYGYKEWSRRFLMKWYKHRMIYWKQLPPMAELVDFLIVDGATGLIESPLSILFETDLVVVPCQRTGVDLHSASDAVRSMHRKLSVLVVKIGSTKTVIATEE